MQNDAVEKKDKNLSSPTLAFMLKDATSTLDSDVTRVLMLNDDLSDDLFEAYNGECFLPNVSASGRRAFRILHFLCESSCLWLVIFSETQVKRTSWALGQSSNISISFPQRRRSVYSQLVSRLRYFLFSSVRLTEMDNPRRRVILLGRTAAGKCTVANALVKGGIDGDLPFKIGHVGYDTDERKRAWTVTGRHCGNMLGSTRHPTSAQWMTSIVAPRVTPYFLSLRNLQGDNSEEGQQQSRTST